MLENVLKNISCCSSSSSSFPRLIPISTRNEIKEKKKKQRPTIKRFNQWLRIKIAIQNEDLDSKKGLKFVNLLISWGMLYVVCVIGIDN